MVQFSIACFLFGAVFGMRFRVTVLLPLTLLLGAIAIVVGALGHLSLLAGLERFAISVLVLQGGYVFGSLAPVARASRVFSRPLKTAR